MGGALLVKKPRFKTETPAFNITNIEAFEVTFTVTNNDDFDADVFWEIDTLDGFVNVGGGLTDTVTVTGLDDETQYNLIVKARAEFKNMSNSVNEDFETLIAYSTNGLVLHLDVNDTNSYPGSGSTWYDISGNNRDFTAVSMPSYNTDGNGLKYFDATSSRDKHFYNPNEFFSGSPAVTVYAILRQSSKQVYAGVFTQNHNDGASSMNFGVTDSTYGNGPFTDHWGPRGRASNVPLNLNQTYKVAWTTVSWGQHTSNLKIHIDGTEVSTFNYTNLFDIANLVADKGTRILQWDPGRNDMHFYGWIYAILVYNRELNGTEITQLDNYFNGKYGL